MTKMCKSLFESGDFVLHAGAETYWRINAEALDASSIATIARMIADRVGPFFAVHGIPTGGEPLAKALAPYCSEEGPLLVVDDVFTTGASMEEYRNYVGVIDTAFYVIFDRSGGLRPSWCKALWTLDA